MGVRVRGLWAGMDYAKCGRVEPVRSSDWRNRWLAGRAEPMRTRRCVLRPGTPAARVYPVSEGMALRASPALGRGKEAEG